MRDAARRLPSQGPSTSVAHLSSSVPVDIARPKRKPYARIAGISVALIATAGITVFLYRLKPAVPSVDAGTLFVDSVRRGDLVIDVHGPGNLVPEHIRQIVAPVAGRVETIRVEGGQPVTDTTVLVNLTNPDAALNLLKNQQDYSQARVDLAQMRSNIEGQRMASETAIAAAEAEDTRLKQELEVDDSLLKRGLIARFDWNNVKARRDAAVTALRGARRTLDAINQHADSQFYVKELQVKQLQIGEEMGQRKIRSLDLRAGDHGVVQEINLQLGQWLNEGALVAKVVQPGKLKAVLRIPESQAKDVLIGQPASVDMHSAQIRGHVSRKDPSAQAGTITIDVALDDALPAGAVPDMSIDGTIQIKKLRDVLYVGRPGYGAGTGMIGVFKMVEDRKYAVRTQVEIGASSVNFVEVKRGLSVGDKVILNELQQADAVDRVRLKW